MMKVLATLLVTIAVFHNVNSAYHAQELRTNERGLLEQAQSLIKDVVQLLQEIIPRASLDVQDVLKRTNIETERTMDHNSRQIGFVSIEIVPKLQDLIQKFTDAGLDTTKCVGKNLDEIRNVVRQCQETSIPECRRGYQDIMDKQSTNTVQILQRMTSRGTKLSDDLNNCSGGLGGIACYSQVIANATMELAKIPIDASKHVADASSTFPFYEIAITKCASDQISKANDKIYTINNNLSRCLSQLLYENSFRYPKA